MTDNHAGHGPVLYEENGISIRHAVEEDLPRMMEIFASARAFMAAHGNPKQWGATGWPPEKLIRQDIAQGTSYVCEKDGQIGAVFFYTQGECVEPTYAQIDDGAWIGGDEYGVVHRIASDGSIPGAGSFCINWAYRQCGHLRIDTHEDNTVMQNLLTKLGFSRCGIIYVYEDRDPRIAFEKL